MLDENIIAPPTDLQGWIEYLAAKPLALLDSTLTFVDQLKSSNNKSIAAICNQILLDPGVIATLVCRANSQNRTRLSTEVTTLENAVKLLGIDNSRGILKRLKVLKLPVRATNLHHYIKTLVRAYHAAYLAYKWAAVRGDSIAKESYIAGLMMHIGEMLLWLYAASDMQKIQEYSVTHAVSLQQAQVQVLGFTIDALSAGINQKWNMPEFVLDCFNSDYLENRRVKGVLLSVKLARLAEQGWYTHAMRSCEQEMAQHFQRDIADVVFINHQVAVDAARDSYHLGEITAAESLISTEFEGMQNTGNVTRVAGFHEKTQNDPRVQPIQDSKLDQTLGAIVASAGFNRAVFCGYEQEAKQCKAVRFVDNITQQQLSRLVIDLSHANLFTRMFEKSQSLFVNAANASKYWPLIPVVVKGLINVKTFVLMSIRVPGKLEGFVYADGSDLDEAKYQIFKKICKELLIDLGA